LVKWGSLANGVRSGALPCVAGDTSALPGSDRRGAMVGTLARPKTS